MAPITGASQYYAPIMLFIEAVNKDHIQKICQYRPLIVDAILQVLSRQPIPVIRRKLDLRNLPAQVLAPINRALGAEIVRAVYVVSGANAKGNNTGSIPRFVFELQNYQGLKRRRPRKAIERYPGY